MSTQKIHGKDSPARGQDAHPLRAKMVIEMSCFSIIITHKFLDLNVSVQGAAG